MKRNDSELQMFLAALRLLIEIYESEQQDAIPIRKIKSLLNHYNLSKVAMPPHK